MFSKQRKTKRGGNTAKNQLSIQRDKRVHNTVDRVPFTGLPRVLDIKFKYYENQFKWELNALNPMRRDVVSLNDPWDPYTTVGGKSANEFQQLMSMYKYCRTYVADVEVNIVQDNFASYKNIVAAMIPNYDNTAIQNLDDLKSQDPALLTISQKPSNVVADALTLRRTYNIASTLGMLNSQYRAHAPSSYYDVSNTGSSIYSPTVLAKLDIYVASLYERDETINPVGEVTIVFHCKLIQKIYQGEYSTINLTKGTDALPDAPIIELNVPRRGSVSNTTSSSRLRGAQHMGH